MNLIVDNPLTGERERRRRSQCVVYLNCKKCSRCLSLNLLILHALEPQCTHLAQSSKIAFLRTYFYLQKAWSSHFFLMSKFQLSSTRFCFRGKLYFHLAPKQKYEIDLKCHASTFSYSDMVPLIAVSLVSFRRVLLKTSVKWGFPFFFSRFVCFSAVIHKSVFLSFCLSYHTLNYV